MREMVRAGRPLHIVASGGSKGRIAAFSALTDEVLMSRFPDGTRMPSRPFTTAIARLCTASSGG
jgi:hypothetical protein